jgi:DNA ligase-associated metallophosphoesterase
MITVDLQVAGAELVLHAERALYWPAQASLLVADVHLGKDDVFRRAGIAVPSGDTPDDLGRLNRLIEHFQPHRLIVLGDLVHGDAHETTPWLAQVREWRRRHAQVKMELIEGNHDRHFDSAMLGFSVIAEHLRLGPFLLSHEPVHDDEAYVLAGHVHPGMVIRDGWRRHRLPAFCFGEKTGLLPAFGAFTGLFELRPMASDRVVVVTPGGLLPLHR